MKIYLKDIHKLAKMIEEHQQEIKQRANFISSVMANQGWLDGDNFDDFETFGEYDSEMLGREFKKKTKEEPKKPACECGKEKHGFTAHSPWCAIASSEEDTKITDVREFDFDD